MGYFDNFLKESETLFRNPVVLDYDYLPKLLPYREKEQHHIAHCIKPLFANRNGKNILLHGPPGIGKTAAVRHVLKELEEKTDDIIPIYVNVWQKNTTYKVIVDICNQLDYKFTHNKKTEELFKILQSKLNKYSVVFCFDEIDKVEDLDFIYMILEQIYRKTIVLITNYKQWAIQLDERINSRLTLELLEFKPYNEKEIRGILNQRKQYAFVPDVWEDDAFALAVKTTAQKKDIRTGLYILREAGNAAEDRSSLKIQTQDVTKAIEKVTAIKIKQPGQLKDDEQEILALIKAHSGTKIGELYELYKKQGGQGVYKTFQRKIEFLSKNKFISTKKQVGGTDGTTTIVHYERETTLDEY